MQIQTAAIVVGSETPEGDGLTGAMRCVLKLPDDSLRAAILKRLPLPGVIAEAFCALLLRGWGLKVPEPFLVQEAGLVSFASADAAYPSLKQRFGIGALPDGDLKSQMIALACNIVVNLAQTPLALVADEAIDNRDRNLGNVLWDGTEAAWIDHERTLGLIPDDADQNKLATMACAVGAHEAMSTSALATWFALPRDRVVEAGAVINAPAHAAFVADRMASLGNRILNRFPAPNDLLSKS